MNDITLISIFQPTWIAYYVIKTHRPSGAELRVPPEAIKARNARGT